MENKSQIQVKGYFLKFDVERLKKTFGNKVLAEVQAKYGRPLQFFSIKYYPVEEEIRLLEIIGKVYYPKDSEEIMWEKLGRDDADTFLNSQFGKITFSFVFSNLKQGLTNISKLFEMVHSGMICEPNAEKFELNIPNNPYPPTYYKGFFEVALEKMGKQEHVVVETGPNKCLYRIEKN